MASVLVANPYVLALDPHEAALRRPYAPINTLVTAAALVESGHDVRVHDATFEPDERHFTRVLRAAVERGATHLALVLDDLSVQIKQCPARIGEAQRAMADMGRELGLSVLCSGPDVSDHPEAYLGHADAVVVGDPVDAAVAWVCGRSDIPGVHGAAGAGGRAPVIRDLDRLPDPDWSAIDLVPYARMWRAAHGHWEAVVSTARGCPYRCNWCAKPTWGRTYSVRSPERVAAEMRLLRDRHGADRFWISDDIFGLRRDWLQSLGEALGAGVPLRCQSRVDLLRDADYAAALADTGCDMVWMGAESGSDDVLRAMDKDGTVADTHAAVANLRAVGVRVGLFLQLGYPGETLRDVHATIDMVRSLRPDEIGVSVSYPLPGTVFHTHVQHALVDTHWRASMENRTLHPAPFSEAFYRAVREVLRSVHSGGQLRDKAEALLRAPSRRGLRRVAGAAWHRARRPVVRRRMSALAVPNPDAIPLGWGQGSPLAGPAGAHVPDTQGVSPG
jgi:anaerobic magnesium-protoporphyrin IX monomethyl ester cyclase